MMKTNKSQLEETYKHFPYLITNSETKGKKVRCNRIYIFVLRCGNVEKRNVHVQTIREMSLK